MKKKIRKLLFKKKEQNVSNLVLRIKLTIEKKKHRSTRNLQRLLNNSLSVTKICIVFFDIQSFNLDSSIFLQPSIFSSLTLFQTSNFAGNMHPVKIASKIRSLDDNLSNFDNFSPLFKNSKILKPLRILDNFHKIFKNLKRKPNCYKYYKCLLNKVSLQPQQISFFCRYKSFLFSIHVQNLYYFLSPLFTKNNKILKNLNIHKSVSNFVILENWNFLKNISFKSLFFTPTKDIFHQIRCLFSQINGPIWIFPRKVNNKKKELFKEQEKDFFSKFKVLNLLDSKNLANSSKKKRNSFLEFFFVGTSQKINLFMFYQFSIGFKSFYPFHFYFFKMKEILNMNTYKFCQKHYLREKQTNIEKIYAKLFNQYHFLNYWVFVTQFLLSYFNTLFINSFAWKKTKPFYKLKDKGLKPRKILEGNSRVLQEASLILSRAKKKNLVKNPFESYTITKESQQQQKGVIAQNFINSSSAKNLKTKLRKFIYFMPPVSLGWILPSYYLIEKLRNTLLNKGHPIFKIPVALFFKENKKNRIFQLTWCDFLTIFNKNKNKDVVFLNKVIQKNYRKIQKETKAFFYNYDFLITSKNKNILQILVNIIENIFFKQFHVLGQSSISNQIELKSHLFNKVPVFSFKSSIINKKMKKFYPQSFYKNFLIDKEGVRKTKAPFLRLGFLAYLQKKYRKKSYKSLQMSKFLCVTHRKQGFSFFKWTFFSFEKFPMKKEKEKEIDFFHASCLFRREFIHPYLSLIGPLEIMPFIYFMPPYFSYNKYWKNFRFNPRKFYTCNFQINAYPLKFLKEHLFQASGPKTYNSIFKVISNKLLKKDFYNSLVASYYLIEKLRPLFFHTLLNKGHPIFFIRKRKFIKNNAFYAPFLNFLDALIRDKNLIIFPIHLREFTNRNLNVSKFKKKRIINTNFYLLFYFTSNSIKKLLTTSNNFSNYNSCNNICLGNICSYKLRKYQRKIKSIIKKYTNIPVSILILLLNMKIRNLLNFISDKNKKKFIYIKIKNYFYRLLWKWACRRHNRKCASWIFKRYWFYKNRMNVFSSENSIQYYFLLQSHIFSIY